MAPTDSLLAYASFCVTRRASCLPSAPVPPFPQSPSTPALLLGRRLRLLRDRPVPFDETPSPSCARRRLRRRAPRPVDRAGRSIPAVPTGPGLGAGLGHPAPPAPARSTGAGPAATATAPALCSRLLLARGSIRQEARGLPLGWRSRCVVTDCAARRVATRTARQRSQVARRSPRGRTTPVRKRAARRAARDRRAAPGADTADAGRVAMDACSQIFQVM